MSLSFLSLRGSKLLRSIRGILWSSCDKSLTVFLGVWMYLLEAGKMLFCFCWGVPVLFPVLTKKENGSVRLCFVPYFCLLIIHLYNCGSSTPGIHTYLSPSSQKPLLDEAGKGDWKNSLNPYKSKEPLYVFENRTPSNFDFFIPWIEILRLRG